jgi:reverse gyrase
MALRMVNVSNLDLNLIRVFDALMEDRSVRRAGLRLGLTQSAISHALNRLRYHLNDKGTVNLSQRCVRELRWLGFSSSQNVAEVLETSHQTAKARSRVARRCSAVAFSG